MVEECLDFLISVKDYSDLLVNRAKTQCLLKITIFIKNDIVYKYPLLVGNLINIYKELLSQIFNFFSI